MARVGPSRVYPALAVLFVLVSGLIAGVSHCFKEAHLSNSVSHEKGKVNTLFMVLPSIPKMSRLSPVSTADPEPSATSECATNGDADFSHLTSGIPVTPL